MASSQAARAAVDRLWPDRPARVTELGGGITNHNYKVEVAGGVFVLRMGGARTELLGIDRAVEHAAGMRAYEVGVGPEVVAFVPSEGWLVARFIEGKAITPDEMREPDTLGRVAAALRRFHEAAPIPGRFDPHAVVEDYRAKALAHGVTTPPQFARAHAMAQRIRAARGEQPVVPCHNDLLNANFIDEAPPSPSATPPHEWGGSVRIVDWEYAGMGDRFFDLANFSVNHEFTVEDDRELLAAYFGQARDEDLASVRLMRFMSDFREAMWGVLQSGISELDFAFTDYAAKHFARLEATASDPSFEAYLRIFEPAGS
ncbi:MAG TPA: choline/ethanolamine kinase family protein [Candidatus Limnocylindrales bacterium]|nr:choline/ethanolamine kinase family protein [Candidatus Limnocylindrales bacterium]